MVRPTSYPPQGNLRPASLPSGVYHNHIPAEAFAARRQVVRTKPDTAKPLFAYVQHMKVHDSPRVRTTWTLETASRGRDAWDVDVGDDAPGGATREQRCEVILAATLPDGTSVAIIVNGFCPSFPVLVKADTPLPVAKTLIERAARAAGIRCKLEFKPLHDRHCTLGYEPDPKDPTRRALAHGLTVYCPTHGLMQRLAKALAKLPPGSPLRPEEFKRLGPEFRFQDERHIAPNSWVILPPHKFVVLDESAPRPSLRTFCVETEVNFILGLEKALSVFPHLSAIAPDPNSIPPTLYAYADIESRSHAEDEFPDPHQERAPCYIFGVTFAWMFGLPSVLARPDVDEDTLRAHVADAQREADVARAEAVREVREKRAARRARRRERLARYARHRGVQVVLGSAAELNSDDESDGSDAEDARAMAPVDSDLREHVEYLQASHRAWPWPSRMGERLWRSEPAWRVGGGGGAAAGDGVVPEFPFLRVLLVLGSCDPIPGAIVVTFDREVDLLKYVRVLLCALMDVDGIRGYNWLNFDSHYIVTRAKLLGVPGTILRLTHVPDYVRYDGDGSWNSSERYTLTTQTGRFDVTRIFDTNTIDLYAFVRQNFKLSSYKLDSVAQMHGLNGKHPIEIAHIYHAYDGTAAERAVVAAYCAQDCDLLVHVARRAKIEVTITQFARIMLTPAEQMWTSGQQIRLLHQIVWLAHRSGFIVDGINESHNARDPALRPPPSGARFDGGFVMDPERAHYRTETATLDYKSLYPSIMISHTICPTTALMSQHAARDAARIRAAGMEVLEIETTGGTFLWVQHPDNLLPTILDRLWKERQATKRLEEKASGGMRVVYNKKQLAIKVSMNSFFGGTGVDHGVYELLRAAHCITQVGRNTVQAARDFANALRSAPVDIGGTSVDLLARAPDETVPPGTPLTPRTVYGDTDSIMVNMPVANRAFVAALRATRSNPAVGILEPGSTAPTTEAEQLLYAQAVANYITNQLNRGYRKPMEIEFEEVAIRAIFLEAKMYVKSLVDKYDDKTLTAITRGEVVGKFKASGIAAARRDKDEYCRRTQRDIAKLIVSARNEARAMQVFRRRAVRLALGEVDTADMVVTTELTNETPTSNSVPPAHVACAWSVERAHPGMQPTLGQRVEWVLSKVADPDRLRPPPRLMRAYPDLARVFELKDTRTPWHKLSTSDRVLLEQFEAGAEKRRTSKGAVARHISEIDPATFPRDMMDREAYIERLESVVRTLLGPRPDLLDKVHQVMTNVRCIASGQPLQRSIMTLFRKVAPPADARPEGEVKRRAGGRS